MLSKIISLVFGFVAISLDSQSQAKPKGYFVIFRCCFNDSATIKYSGELQRMFLNTDESVDMDIKNFLFYPSDSSNANFLVEIDKSMSNVKINLPPTDSVKYINIWKTKGTLTYEVSSKKAKLQ